MSTDSPVFVPFDVKHIDKYQAYVGGVGHVVEALTLIKRKNGEEALIGYADGVWKRWPPVEYPHRTYLELCFKKQSRFKKQPVWLVFVNGTLIRSTTNEESLKNCSSDCVVFKRYVNLPLEDNLCPRKL